MITTKKLLILVLMLALTAVAFAADIAVKKAEIVAKNWLEFKAQGGLDNLDIENVYTTNYEGAVTLYTFAFKEGGFVIVSADDQVTPILGYSITNTATEILPPAVENWLEMYSQQIYKVKAEKLANSKALIEWKNIIKKDFSHHDLTTDVVYPLLEDIEWDQNAVWNDFCPVDANGPGGHAYAGCAAVAMGQIIRYWNHPYQYGTGSHSYYPASHPEYGRQSADFENGNYVYFRMSDGSPNSYSSKLLYHCGVSVDMDYGPDGSISTAYKASNALKNYFRYSNNITFRHRSDYYYYQWTEMIQDDLDDGFPLIYRGGNHVFVLDGFDGTSEYHFNWGWSGSYNGYYTLDDLTPGSHDFNNAQGAAFGIEKSPLEYPRWDVTQDGEVDIFDCTVVGITWGYLYDWPYPPWDINEDGEIDIFDAVLIGIHWGEVYGGGGNKIADISPITSTIDFSSAYDTNENGVIDDSEFIPVFNDYQNGVLSDDDFSAFMLFLGNRYETEAPTVPSVYSLSENYPNPFNPTTTISYSLPEAGNVNLAVYNINGQLVNTLVDEHKTAGSYDVVWNGTDASDNTVTSGIYFYKIKAGDFAEAKRMMLVK